MGKNKHKNKHRNKHRHNTSKGSILVIISIILFSMGGIFYILQQSYVNAGNQEEQILSSIAMLPQTNDLHSTDKLTKQITDNLNNNLDTFISNSKQKYKETFDMENDASLQKYISKNHPLNNPKFIPPDLEPYDQSYLVNKALKPVLRRPARIALEKMTKDFYKTFNIKLCIRSAYRSYEDQERLLLNGCHKSKCAAPAASEHNLGTAVDINILQLDGTCKSFSQGSKYYQRLETNGIQYGFNNTYKRGSHQDGIAEESRHRDYNGKYFAKFLYDNDLTISEYYYQVNKDN